MEILRSAEPSQDAAAALGELLRKHQKQQVLLLLSGGSWFSVLDRVDTECVGARVTLGVVDERCSTDERVNNFAQLAQTEFYTTARAFGAGAIDTRVTDEAACADLREEWETQLKKWLHKNPDGVVIATLGIGEDGHTAGMFPRVSQDFENEWVVSYEVSPDVNPHTTRITLTHAFLRECPNEAVVYAVGDKKAPVIEALEKGEVCDLVRTPACVLREMRSVRLFTDLQN